MAKTTYASVTARTRELLAVLKLLAGALLSGKNADGTDFTVPVADAGTNWTAVHKVVNSADASAATAVADVPVGGQKLVLTDLHISVGAALTVTIKEETSNTVMHGPFYMAANSSINIRPRSRMSKLATADRKYMVVASGAGNITVETWTFSEA